MPTNNKNTAIYLKSLAESRASGEEKLYDDSRCKNFDCARAIESAISNSDNVTAVTDVVAKFGLDRTAFVLANTICNKLDDGTFSKDNILWADSFDIRPEVQNAFGIINTNLSILDHFTAVLRERYDKFYSQQVGSYEIKKTVLFSDNCGFSYAESTKAVSPYVTWQFRQYDGKGNYNIGHYFSNKNNALVDFRKRVTEYRNYFGVEEVGIKPSLMKDLETKKQQVKPPKNQSKQKKKENEIE